VKKGLIVLAVLLLAVSFAAAQIRTGTIYGKVTDTEKTPLPGVTVTLSSNILAPLTTITSAKGMFRFLSLSSANDYQLTAELTGFKKASKTGIIVTIGANVEIDLTMEMGKVEEEVTVTAVSPVVDTKKTAVGSNVNKEAMQSLPTARDPWVVLQLVPGVIVDRENVGGNESGQQSGFIAKGDTSSARISGNQGANNTWSIDGIDITDPAALGGSAPYYDFDMFEELQIQTGGAADVTIQTGGINLNMVTRRGGNKMSLAGRFYLTDNFFQADNLTQALIAKGVARVNKIQYVKDYGFNVGGPILKDKVWWWGAYGVQDIFVWTIVGAKDTTLLNNYNFKLNAQLLANNRFEFLLTAGAKEKYGRDSSVASPEGNHQQGKYHWGSPIVKFQDEHSFGSDFFVSLKYSFNDAGFMWRPVTDESVQYPIVYDQVLSKYVAYKSGMNASWGSYGVSRPRNNYQVQATYFNDSFLGMSHEIKVGAEYSHKVQSTEGNNTGNIQGFDITRNYSSATLDTNADGTLTLAEMAGWQRVALYRRTGSYDIAQQYAAYIQDTIVKGNFTLQLGLRFDKQWPSGAAYTRDAIPGGTAWNSVFDPAVTAVLKNYLPAINVDAVKGIDQLVTGGKRTYQWNTFSPRIGLTYDIFGDGKTVAKLALSQYGDIMGVGWYNAAPYGTGGGIRFWWRDLNGDNMMTFNEMYWAYSDRQAVGTRNVPYLVFNNSGALTANATAMLANGSNSDAYYGGQYYSYDFSNPTAPPDYKYGVTTYFLDKSAQSSGRTRELLLTLEREIFTDFSASVSFTYRKLDNDQMTLTYYPTEHAADYPAYTGPAIIDPRTPPAGKTWYVQAGTIPATYIIGGTWALVGGVWTNTGGTTYSSGDAAGKPYYLPGTNWPTTTTRYSVVRNADDYFTYTGLDFVVNKRLSHKWMMNTSFTWLNQKQYWGSDYFNPTNKWCFDGLAYGDWGGGASGKVAALMYTRWMVKFSGLYQLPIGFNISGTFNAREGWRIPNYFTIDNFNAPNYAAGHSTTVYKQPYTQDALPTFYNITLRLEKLISIGNYGRLYLMADAFNLLNSNMAIRSYDKNDGTAQMRDVAGVSTQYNSSALNATNGLLNEILNSRIFRFGARFEF
jgi:hypothetical protein